MPPLVTFAFQNQEPWLGPARKTTPRPQRDAQSRIGLFIHPVFCTGLPKLSVNFLSAKESIRQDVTFNKQSVLWLARACRFRAIIRGFVIPDRKWIGPHCLTESLLCVSFVPNLIKWETLRRFCHVPLGSIMLSYSCFSAIPSKVESRNG